MSRRNRGCAVWVVSASGGFFIFPGYRFYQRRSNMNLFPQRLTLTVERARRYDFLGDPIRVVRGANCLAFEAPLLCFPTVAARRRPRLLMRLGSRTEKPR